MPTPVETTNEQTLNCDLSASTTNVVSVVVRMKVRGKIQETLGPFTFAHSNGDRSREQTAFDIPKGEILAVNAFIASSVKRGQAYIVLLLERRGRSMKRLGRGYMYNGQSVELGDNVEPLSGRGYLNWVQEANDAAGNTTTTVNLAASDARRIVRGIILKYHQTGGSAATITITLRDLADSGGPTNWSIASDTWVSPSLVLGANEEGLIHVGEHGFLSTNDAGTIAYADNTTAPNPFPLEVEEGETADLIIAASGGASGDDYDVWVHYEEWLDV